MSETQGIDTGMAIDTVVDQAEDQTQPEIKQELDQHVSSTTSTATQSPQIKSEELQSTRETPVPQVLQFQVPQDLKPSEVIGGAPVRQWLNENVTPHLLDGMRKIASERPQDPLRVLGEYLIQQSDLKVKSES